jgi:hypothetical protein
MDNFINCLDWYIQEEPMANIPFAHRGVLPQAAARIEAKP